MDYPDNPSQSVLQSCRMVMDQNPQHVQINFDQLNKFAEDLLTRDSPIPSFDTELHFIDPNREDITAQYLLVIDCINFCFWPSMNATDQGATPLEYEHIASGIKSSVLKDPECISAHNLSTINEEKLQQLIQWPHPLPLASERVSLLRELGNGLLSHGYDGNAGNLVRSCCKSTQKLIKTLIKEFPGFNDRTTYNNQPIHFYKRAQIFCADLYGAFEGKGLGEFDDIDQLTMFADYRVPQVLREYDVLQYSSRLASTIDAGIEIEKGSKEEVEIRAATVCAVDELHKRVSCRGDTVALRYVFQLDWVLWEFGEERRYTMKNHHRTRTTNY